MKALILKQNFLHCSFNPMKTCVYINNLFYLFNCQLVVKNFNSFYLVA